MRYSPIFWWLYYGLKIDVLEHKIDRRNSWKDQIDYAISCYLNEKDLKDEVFVEHLKKDIDRCYRIAKLSPIEYFMYNLTDADEERVKSFVSDKVSLSELSKLGLRRLHDEELEDKYKFYCINREYFKRDVIQVLTCEDYEEFEEMALKNNELIFKPNGRACGSGIFIEDVFSKKDVKDVFAKIVKNGGAWVIEKRIRQSKEMASWNESSVNTVRVTTFNNKRGIFVYGPFLRLGRNGQVVDNGGAGGVFAAIDVETGVVLTEGKDERSYNSYLKHPDSGKQIKGWQVPDWEELKKLVIDIHRKNMNKHLMIGWDFAHTDDGWVLIEGNWGQWIQQAFSKNGFAKDFYENISLRN